MLISLASEKITNNLPLFYFSQQQTDTGEDSIPTQQSVFFLQIVGL